MSAYDALNASYQEQIIEEGGYRPYALDELVKSIIVGEDALGRVRAIDSRGFVSVIFHNVNKDDKDLTVAFFANGLPLRGSGWGQPIQPDPRRPRVAYRTTCTTTGETNYYKQTSVIV